MPYYICHKCGLTRQRKPMKPEGTLPPDLGGCECTGRTQFIYEETPRSRDEAIVIGVDAFLGFIALYVSQRRAQHEFRELIKHYEKVLAYKAVYKVEIRR